MADGYYDNEMGKAAKKKDDGRMDATGLTVDGWGFTAAVFDISQDAHVRLWWVWVGQRI